MTACSKDLAQVNVHFSHHYTGYNSGPNDISHEWLGSRISSTVSTVSCFLSPNITKALQNTWCLWSVRYHPKTPMLAGDKCVLESHSHTMYRGRKLGLLSAEYGGLLCPCSQIHCVPPAPFMDETAWRGLLNTCHSGITPAHSSELWSQHDFEDVTSLPFFLHGAIKEQAFTLSLSNYLQYFFKWIFLYKRCVSLDNAPTQKKKQLWI